jgi:hypothetical protein
MFPSGAQLLRDFLWSVHRAHGGHLSRPTRGGNIGVRGVEAVLPLVILRAAGGQPYLSNPSQNPSHLNLLQAAFNSFIASILGYFNVVVLTPLVPQFNKHLS